MKIEIWFKPAQNSLNAKPKLAYSASIQKMKNGCRSCSSFSENSPHKHRVFMKVTIFLSSYFLP